MQPTISIRRFQPGDEEDCSEAAKMALINENSKDYPDFVISYMVSVFTPAKMLEISKERIFIVPEIIIDGKKKVVGTATLIGNYVGSVFIHSSYIHKGIGKRLMHEIEKIARDQGHRKIELWASLTALVFYRKLGYKIGRKRDTGNMGVVRKATKKL